MSDQPVALVTAASRGMGAAIARRLHADGYRLALLSRSDDLQALADELDALAVLGSVTEPGDLEALFQQALDRYGRIDAVVNNTGHPPGGELLALDDDAWHSGLDLVLLNVVRMTRLVVPVMKRQGSGALVNISAFGAVEPSLDFPASSVLRAGLAAYTKLFSDRYAAAGIRMNDVLPGFIDTYDIDDATRDRIPLERRGTVAEVAGAVAFLLSEDAAYITGQTLRVDGGLTRSVG